MKPGRLFENKKQKAIWVVYILLVLNKLLNLPKPPSKWCESQNLINYGQFNNPSCSYNPITYWGNNFSGYLIFFLFLTAIFIVIAIILKDKKK